MSRSYYESSDTPRFLGQIAEQMYEANRLKRIELKLAAVRTTLAAVDLTEGSQEQQEELTSAATGSIERLLAEVDAP